MKIRCKANGVLAPKMINHNQKNATIPFIICLAPRAGKMNEILCYDWLPERARWSYLARSGLPAVSRQKNLPESHTIKLLLTKLFQSRWLDIGLVLLSSRKTTCTISSHLDRTSLISNLYLWIFNSVLQKSFQIFTYFPFQSTANQFWWLLVTWPSLTLAWREGIPRGW